VALADGRTLSFVDDDAHHDAIGAHSRLAGLGHLAIWAGLYVAGAVASLALATGVSEFGARASDWLALVAACCLGISVYTVDRVKFADRLTDPADRFAHPERHAFVYPHRRALRWFAASLGAVALIAATLVHPLLAVPVLGAYLGVHLYAGWPPGPDRRRRRLKDMLVVKNLTVALSIASLCAAFLLGVRPPDGDPASMAARMAIPFAALVSIVFADAMLCDLDDVPADRRFGTRTIPGTASPGLTWAVALAVQVAAGAALVVASAALSPGFILLGVGLPLTTFVLWLVHPRRIRDIVDVRLGVLAAAALALTHLV
jgi:hypothetical protein